MPPGQASGAVVSQIEGILESVLSSLAHHQPASITLASKQSGTVSFEDVRFPGRTLSEARKFARVLLIFQLAHDSVVSGIILTKRNVFYQNQDLFSDQAQVDVLVDAVALTLAVGREDLNIVATSKGLLVGPSVIHLHDGSALDLSRGDSGTPIPLPTAIESIDLSRVRWVLATEKDAVFRTLCSTRYWENSTSGPGLIITAKGYPDLITRDFLHLINQSAPNLMILTLTDYDVDGLNIARCYRFSKDPTSRAQATINAGITWLGINTAQVLHLVASMSSQDEIASRNAVSPTEVRESVTHLTPRDRKVAVGVLAGLSNYEVTDQQAAELKIELQRLLMLGAKYEIQCLDESGDIAYWLDQRLAWSCYRC